MFADGSASTLRIDNPDAFEASIVGFSGRNRIDLQFLPRTGVSESFSDGELTLTSTFADDAGVPPGTVLARVRFASGVSPIASR